MKMTFFFFAIFFYFFSIFFLFFFFFCYCASCAHSLSQLELLILNSVQFNGNRISILNSEKSEKAYKNEKKKFTFSYLFYEVINSDDVEVGARKRIK